MPLPRRGVLPAAVNLSREYIRVYTLGSSSVRRPLVSCPF